MVSSITTDLLKNRAFVLTIGLALLLVTLFWTGSRYPDLDQKAMMAGETPFSALGFDTLIDMPPAPALPVEIAVNTVNWLYTNWKGMVFGLLAGALLLTALPHLQGLRSRSHVANSALGMAIGTPLGVCVNCATPVAQGALSGRARPETALAILVSSPTLNAVVLTMLLSLFPIYMAVTKIGLTIVFILLALPLITRIFPASPPRSQLPGQAITAPFNFSFTPPPPDRVTADSWLLALRSVLNHSARNLLYLARITVPLMILAGALGAAAVTLVPFGSLEHILPSGGRYALVGAMLVLALFALFLPTPMALDVLVAAVLFQAGLPAGYVMVLLFTLGIFSVYPFLMIWWQMSPRIAMAMSATLMLFGVGGGIFAHLVDRHVRADEERNLIANLKNAPPVIRTQAIRRTPPTRPAANVLSELTRHKRVPALVAETDDLQIQRWPHTQRSAASELQFQRFEGADIGIGEQAPATYLKSIIPYNRLRSMASGDIHNDGWPDLVTGSAGGLAIYANINGKRFERQQIDIPELAEWPIGTIALVDLNNDGWRDLFVATVGQGTWMIKNSGGRFPAAQMVEIPNTERAIWSTAPSFADIDKNGLLDVVHGNSTFGDFSGKRSLPRAANALAMQYTTGWRMEPLPAYPAETLSTLVTDINADNWPDLIVGDDFAPGDVVYLNNGRGQLHLQQSPTDVFASGTFTTMSLSTADINNDLRADIYFAQKAWERHQLREHPPAQSCAEITSPTMRHECEAIHQQRLTLVSVMLADPGKACRQWPHADELSDCLALAAWHKMVQGRTAMKCDHFDSRWPVLAAGCRLHEEMQAGTEATDAAYRLPSSHNRNLLYLSGPDGQYREVGADFGVKYGGWAWNAKFNDLDNDEYQDLFIATGDIHAKLRHPSVFYRNHAGKQFRDMTQATGLHSMLDTLSYTYVDYDGDGDQDIIAAPIVGPMLAFRNNLQSGNSIDISLRDLAGNRSAIGARIIIRYGKDEAQMREISASGGHLSFDAPVAHFGLGNHTSVEHIVITWPTGRSTEVKGPFKAGHHYIVTRKNR